MELFDASGRFPGFEYPDGLQKIADLDLVDLDIWFIMDAPFTERYCTSMDKRYPERNLVPFRQAQRQR